MKEFIKKSILLISSVLGMILIIIFVLPKQYENVYTSVLVSKYQRLMDINEPKIILVGGSSMAFGINSEMLEKETGMQVVNLGMHAGLGNRFCLEIANDNINEGDIVIFAPEYWTDTELQAELALISCQDNWNLLKNIPDKDRVNVLKTLSLYCKKKVFMFITNSGNAPNDPINEYDPQFFNEYGDNIYERKINPFSVENVAAETLVFNPEEVSTDLCNYVNEIDAYCKSQGATMYISFAPIVSNSVVYDGQTIEEFVNTLDNELTAEIISNPIDYIWPFEMFYGTNFHLSNEGADERTQQLILDLNSVRSD